MNLISISSFIKDLKESPTISIMLKAKELKKKGIEIYNFGVGEMNPMIEIPSPVKDGIIKALNDNQTYYCSPQGDEELIQAIVEDFQNNFKMSYKNSQIQICSGPKDAIGKILMCILNPCSERNRVIAFKPTFESFTEVPFLLTGKPTILLDSDINGIPNLNQLKNYLKENFHFIAAIIINSPNNPSGSIYSKEIIEELVNIMKLYPHIAIISDEVYRTICYENNINYVTSIAKYLPNQTLIVGGMSKEVSGTGLRIGPENIIQSITTIQGHFSSSVNLPTQKGYAYFLKMDKDMKYRINIKNELKKKRDILILQFKTLQGLEDFIFEPPKGTFYFFPCITNFFGRKIPNSNKIIENDTDFCLYILETAYVVTIPGSKFNKPGFLRFAYACLSTEEIKQGCLNLSRACLQLQK